MRNKFIAVFLISCVLCLNCYCIPTVFSSAAESYAKAECVMEQESRRILYENNSDTRLPMASTTKILTAITVIENVNNLQEEITVPQNAVGTEGSSIYLKEGERLSVEDLLYGLMLRSGNDAAVALALKTANTIEKFSILMNRTAQKAGAQQSNFVNPHGLSHKNHYTTAKDLSYITCYAMHNSKFREIVSTKFYQPRTWVNKNKMLKLYENSIGVKTGYTKEAGRCLVSAAEKDNLTLVCSVLSCVDMYNRSISLLSDCFSKYKRELIVEKNQVFDLLDNGKKIKAVTGVDFFYPIREEEKAYIEFKVEKLENSSSKSLNEKKNGEIIGQIKIFLLKRLIFSGNLYKL